MKKPESATSDGSGDMDPVVRRLTARTLAGEARWSDRDPPRRHPMYLARFSYDVLPVNRQRAVEFIKREVQAARARNLRARLLIPLTRGHGGAALQFEIEMRDLDELDQFTRDEAGQWMHAFSEILTAPPEVAILRLDDQTG